MSEETKKVLVDVYFTVEYSHLVEVEVPVGTPKQKIDSLARKKCFDDMIGHVETALESVSGCYVSKSLTCNDVIPA